ncbi:hypothetical protein HUJ04_004801 [Dendroctonus ponderosae]|nr:hypothetical protein HUJ04_004801 [Dendroctonus ponderosae]KAH1015090.1 hypothetical protein HUJ05_012868 [Dendroctonus ponderosae]
MGFAKDLVAEQETLLRALNQRPCSKKIGSEMACRINSLNSQLKVWGGNRINYAELIETMKDEQRTEIDNLQQIIEEQQQKLARQDKRLPTSHFQLLKEKYKL